MEGSLQGIWLRRDPQTLSTPCPMLVMQAHGLRIRSGLMRKRRLTILGNGPV